MALIFKTDENDQFCEECVSTTTIFDLADGWAYYEPGIAEICGAEEGMIYFCDGCNGEIKREERISNAQR
jgi:hypothetical protein